MRVDVGGCRLGCETSRSYVLTEDRVSNINYIDRGYTAR